MRRDDILPLACGRVRDDEVIWFHPTPHALLKYDCLQLTTALNLKLCEALAAAAKALSRSGLSQRN